MSSNRSKLSAMTTGQGSASAEWLTDLEKALRKRHQDRKRYRDLAEKPDLPKEDAAKIKLVIELMETDEEVLELKRINSLSLERIKEHQRRSMQTMEEKGMYAEEGITKQILEYYGNAEHDKKKVTEHWMQARKNRYVFIVIKFVGTMSLWWLMHRWYAGDPNLMWVEKPSKVWRPRISHKEVGVIGGNIDEPTR